MDSWTGTRITFTLPAPGNGYHLWSGTPASVTVVSGSGIISNAAGLSSGFWVLRPAPPHTILRKRPFYELFTVISLFVFVIP